MLLIDSRLCLPTVGITTTTRRPDFSLGELRDAERALWRALRGGRRVGVRGPRRKGERCHEAFPDLRYCAFLEWTTGQGTHSDGHRRPHLHHLVKGIPADHPLLARQVDVDGHITCPLERRVSELWHAITGDAFIVEARPLRTPVGAIRYLTLHHRKKSQAPPAVAVREGKIRRLRSSREVRPTAKNPVGRRGYYEKPIAELREEAQGAARNETVRYLVSRAVSSELRGRGELELDEELSGAIVEALRSMRESPPEAQLGMSGEEYDVDNAEFERRVACELARARKENPGEVVRVRERECVDPATGIAVREAVAVLGPLPFRHRKVA